ncbi:unnamed protein product [Rotaria magnacalcarata]
MIFVTLLINYLFLFSNIGREIDDSIVEVTLTKWVDKNQYFRFTRSVSLLSIAANLPLHCRLNFMANINFEYFKNFKYYAVPNGELCCPVCGDKETFQTSGSMDGLTLEETKMVWNHVHEAHSIDFDRIYNKLQSSSTFIPRESVVS